MICFATIGLRYSFMLNAARQAAHAAVQAKSFEQSFGQDLSAQAAAQAMATTCCRAFSGVTLNTVTTSIVITPVQGGTPTMQDTKLNSAADEENFLYQIQVQLQGELSPLIPMPSGMFGMRVPGLTEPYPIQTLAREVCENTQGLNK